AGGGSVDWDARFAGRAVHRLSLPTYPFATRRHWVDSDRPARPSDGSVISAQDEIVAGHLVRGTPTGPGVVHLSRRHASGGPPGELRDVVWSRAAAVPAGGLALTVRTRTDGAEVRATVVDSTGTQFCEGAWSAAPAPADRRVDIGAAQSGGPRRLTPAEFYAAPAAAAPAA